MNRVREGLPSDGQHLTVLGQRHHLRDHALLQEQVHTPVGGADVALRWETRTGMVYRHGLDTLTVMKLGLMPKLD